MRKLRIVVCMSALTVVLGTTLIAAPGAGADEGKAGNSKRVRILDDCDQASFNAAFGPGACVGDGETTVDDLMAQLGATGSAEGWAFKPANFHVDADESIKAVNKGGEFHTFTEVAAFGGGCIQDVNDIVRPKLQPVPECAPTVEVDGEMVPAALVGTGVEPGGTLQVNPLKPGTHKFECLVHPWMRAVVGVRADKDADHDHG